MAANSLPAARAPVRARGARQRNPSADIQDDRLWRWLTLSPALALMLGLSLLPLANLFLLSFFNVEWLEGRANWHPVGLENYRALADDNLFHAGLINTTVFAAAAVAGQMVLGFALALLSTKIERGRVLYRAVFILPILIPGIVIGAIWKLMLNFDFGLVNQALALGGIGPHDWLGASETALLSVVIVDIWHWTPFCFLLFLAGLESLPQDMYEAAKIDGASAWQELIHVTLPLMMPTILVTFAFRLVLAFKVFDEVYLLTGGGPGTATELPATFMYSYTFTRNQMGIGATSAVIMLMMIAAIIVPYLWSELRERK